MNIFVCVGSSCHLSGSARIVELMKSAVERNNLNDKVKLSGAFRRIILTKLFRSMYLIKSDYRKVLIFYERLFAVKKA